MQQQQQLVCMFLSSSSTHSMSHLRPRSIARRTKLITPEEESRMKEAASSQQLHVKLSLSLRENDWNSIRGKKNSNVWNSMTVVNFSLDLRLEPADAVFQPY